MQDDVYIILKMVDASTISQATFFLLFSLLPCAYKEKSKIYHLPSTICLRPDYYTAEMAQMDSGQVGRGRIARVMMAARAVVFGLSGVKMRKKCTREVTLADLRFRGTKVLVKYGA